jgi:hypothetical protein
MILPMIMNEGLRRLWPLTVVLTILIGTVAAMAQSLSQPTAQAKWSIDCSAVRKAANGDAFLVVRDTVFIETTRNNQFGQQKGQVITRRQVNYMGADLFDVIADKCGSI